MLPLRNLIVLRDTVTAIYFALTRRKGLTRQRIAAMVETQIGCKRQGSVRENFDLHVEWV
jgi:hypothetical protein